jgi:phage/conjugal plasmid C-4 type zinc finger TraR family protein
MADDIDRANDIAQESLERSLAKAAKFSEPSYSECLDCGEDIPYQRQQLGGVKYCIDCQTVLERRR